MKKNNESGLYFVIPLSSDETKIGYSKEQINWAKQNEEYIWKYFIENELLYETDDDLIDRFISEFEAQGGRRIEITEKYESMYKWKQ